MVVDSVKSTIPEHVGNMRGSTHHLNDLITNNVSVQQYLLMNN